MTAQPDSNATGSTHPGGRGFERCAASHGRCRTVKDRLGVKWFATSRLCSDRVLTRHHGGHHVPLLAPLAECERSIRKIVVIL